MIFIENLNYYNLEKKPAVREHTKKLSSSNKKSSNNIEKTEKRQSTNNSNTKILKPKDSLIYQVLKRWWYAIEDWPPTDFNPS